MLLDGLVETDRGGRLRSRYLKDGSPDELNARVALSKLLRSDEGPNRRLRDFLAELFDPNPPARQQRKLIFAFRRPGKKTDPYANAHVFVEVATAVKSGSTAAAAIADTAQQHGISEELEPISKSSEEDNEAGELDKAEEVLSVVLPADEYATLPLYPGEEALDEPAPLVTA